MIAFGKITDGASHAPFLIEIAEHESNELKIVVALAACGEIEAESNNTGSKQVDSLLRTCVSINADTDNRYEIVFENYVFYMIRNESFAQMWGEDEIVEGDYFVLFENSILLDFLPHIAEVEIIKACYQQGCHHYGIICQNHFIDVIATSEPRIRLLFASQA